eukprot:CAMPEP_0197687918 /NCGR_PEP_ID=MMETSP1338-20131121/104654_1 /TAXON_ID=43686 ORGANISM="Pelagodinium beii, Strain RCC1491" /NCGR_SAMPLE_ID=MMETSP1338 /ASSEMBLY_ACC=CAM_ASM_000754 /LENGTH=52 /DNA_ID=CAMNT_0043270077 /DNA_START=256 /DNA_END=414 /DNA_ORIENTATION=+
MPVAMSVVNAKHPFTLGFHTRLFVDLSGSRVDDVLAGICQPARDLPQSVDLV